MAKYTFLIPAYKTRYLREALDSMLAQTYRDFDIVVSDDCSPEDIKSIVSPLKVTYRRNPQNIGSKNLADHWNLLVNQCKTPYLIMASDDDVYDPEFLEKINQLVEKYPDVDIFRARVRFIDKDGEPYLQDPAFNEYANQLQWFQQNYTPGMLKCMANFVFKTEALQKAGGFEHYPLAWYSDIATVLKMGSNGAANTQDILFSFRMSGLNISSEEQTTRAAARLKLDASYQYDKWMTTQILNLKYEHNRLNNGIYAKLLPAHRNEIVTKFVNYAKAASFREMLSFVRYCRQHHYFDSNLKIYWLIKEWLKASYK